MVQTERAVRIHMCNRHRTLFLTHIHLLLHICFHTAAFSLSIRSQLQLERTVLDDKFPLGDWTSIYSLA